MIGDRHPLSPSVVIVATVAEAGAAEVPEPEGYRLENYRSADAGHAARRKVLGTDEAETIWRSCIGVLCRRAAAGRRGHGICRRERFGTTSREPTFPAASGCPTPAMANSRPSMADYFARGLEKGNRMAIARRLLVFYCLADCWMSWNAAKRALSLGYSNVAWYREGTDGWRAAGLPLQEATPEPRPGE